MAKTFADIREGNVVIVYDEYAHDYIEHALIVDNIEYDKENITPENPTGKICYGTDLDEDWYGDDYMTVITISNFVRIAEKDEKIK